MRLVLILGIAAALLFAGAAAALWWRWRLPRIVVSNDGDRAVELAYTCTATAPGYQDFAVKIDRLPPHSQVVVVAPHRQLSPGMFWSLQRLDPPDAATQVACSRDGPSPCPPLPFASCTVVRIDADGKVSSVADRWR